MSTLKLVGFFRELPHGFIESDSIFDKIREIVPENKVLILNYLQSNNVLASSRSFVYDVIDKEKMIVSINIITDGIWAWPSDLVYYFDKYNLIFPSNFYDHMEKVNWYNENLTDDELKKLSFY